MTESQRAALERAAASRGMAIGYYIRHRLFPDAAVAYEPRYRENEEGRILEDREAFLALSEAAKIGDTEADEELLYEMMQANRDD